MLKMKALFYCYANTHLCLFLTWLIEEAVLVSFHQLLLPLCYRKDLTNALIQAGLIKLQTSQSELEVNV